MDSAKKAYAQLAQAVQSMTPGARVASLLLVGLVVLCLGYLARRPSTADTFLLGGEPFGTSQLTAMEAAFAKAGLKTYEIQSNRVQVPRAEQSAYMAALADAGALPPDFGKYLEKAINSPSPFMSKAEREAMIKVALQNELRLIIRSMKGIENASVLYDVEARQPFGQERVATASVSVKPVGSQPLDEERIPLLRHMVASSIAGLRPENVTVTDLNGRLYSGGVESDGAGLGGDVYSNRKKTYERDWVEKITKAIGIPGAVVTANVELDLEREHEETEVTYDQPPGNPNPAPAADGDHVPSADRDHPTAGAEGDRFGSLARLIAPAVDGFGHRPSRATPNRSKRITQQGMTPKRVTVTVGIPSSHYEKVWHEKHPARPGAAEREPDELELAAIEASETQRARQVAERLLPVSDSTQESSPRVVVTSFQNIGSPVPAPPSVSGWPESAAVWLSQYGIALAAIVLAGCGLLTLRSLIHAPRFAAAAVPSPPPPVETDAVETREFDDVQEHLAGAHWNRGVERASLREELADLVRDDPDAAVSVLRSWIGNAS